MCAKGEEEKAELEREMSGKIYEQQRTCEMPKFSHLPDLERDASGATARLR